VGSKVLLEWESALVVPLSTLWSRDKLKVLPNFLLLFQGSL
jgi:hypothetical protein